MKFCNRFIVFFLSITLYAGLANAQYGTVKEFTNFTMYYVDNSDGYQAASLSDGIVQEIKEGLTKLTKRPDNYFMFYGCDGSEYKTSNNLATLRESSFLRKYLNHPSKVSEYSYDKKSLREYFTQNQIKIKQNIEINIFLSENAVRRAFTTTDEVPVTVLLISELPIYLSEFAKVRNDMRIKIKFYINEEAKERFTESRIVNFFSFCTEQLNLGDFNTEFVFL